MEAERTDTGTFGEINRLLARWGEGDAAAEERLLALIYPQLQAMAALRRPQQGGDLILQTTDLVHEAYLRLLGQQAGWSNRAHFFAIAARVMRRVVIDDARRRGREKRGGEVQWVALEEVSELPRTTPREWIDLDRALDGLAAIDERAARLVELRYFAGLTVEEAAGILGCSEPTAARDWRFARAWLRQRLADG